MTSSAQTVAAFGRASLSWDVADGPEDVAADEFSVAMAGSGAARGEDAKLEDAEGQKLLDIEHAPHIVLFEVSPLAGEEEPSPDRVCTEHLLKNPHEAAFHRQYSEESGKVAAESFDVTHGEPGSIDDFQIWRVETHLQLREALEELAEVREVAREEKYPQPSATALKNAGRLLREIYRVCPCEFLVHPTRDGEVAIDAFGKHRRSVLLLCASDGSALCFVHTRASNRRARYSTADDLPDAFLREALEELR